MTPSSSALKKRAQQIKLVAMDVDGVLTGGEIIVLDSGEEVKLWSAKDRLIIAVMRDYDGPLIFSWLTGRSSQAVERAAHDLGVHHLVQKCDDKKAALAEILKERHLTPSEAAFIGDDLIDIPVMKSAGFAACPADAASDVIKVAHYVSSKKGGQGVARDVLEFILKAQRKWDSLIKPFLL
jgi:3-deoxy-D-manno-octulosonate 8-phosphate phosphatase (KDO 8-P phosphatase)